MDTRSTASSSTDTPDPDQAGSAPASGSAGSGGPGGSASANGGPGGPGGSGGSAPAAQPQASDPDRRAFFRVFGRQAVQTVAQVAGMASAVSQLPVNALTGLAELTAPAPAPALPPARPAAAVTPDAPYRSPYRLTEDSLVLLDQRRLPDAADEQVCRRGADVAFYLRVGAAHGGPLMAQLAAYGMALSAREHQASLASKRTAELRRVGRVLAQARSGSRMLRWSVDRAWALADALPEDADGPAVATLLRADADARAADAQLDHAVMARWLEGGLRHPDEGALHVLVHGDPGALSCGLVGPGLVALANRVAAGGQVRVWVTETAPGMEGARLASWELATQGIDHTIVADTAVGALVERERIDALVVGGEWVAANGDVGAIVGSRMVAAMAATATRGPIPVFVVAPIATFDADTPDGAAIPVTDRPSRDLQAHVTGTRLARSRGWNPATDVIPAAWVTSIVTEMGMFAPTDGTGLAAALAERESRRPLPGPS